MKFVYYIILAAILVNCSIQKQENMETNKPIFNCPKDLPKVVPQYKGKKYLV